ncbi:hypothetical protein Adu01nite_54940 [Paractinoplanes durhamensis]|uniref:Uncharacterized protein n=1 Tax=Paractinoplanes durhamensis TaxID=113563 RepID=A0ABQ3Z2U6_9ACTN|nr:hypothetical protein Adu01nite_54940 [Actinoplanes durhamensis]
MIGERLRPIPRTPLPIGVKLPDQVIHREQRPPHPLRLEPPPNRGDLSPDPRPEVHGPFPKHKSGEPDGPPKPGPTDSRSPTTDLNLNVTPPRSPLVGGPKCPDRKRNDVVPNPGHRIGPSKPKVPGHKKPNGRGRKLHSRNRIPRPPPMNPSHIPGPLHPPRRSNPTFPDPSDNLSISEFPR